MDAAEKPVSIITRVTLEHDVYANRVPLATIGKWTLIDAGPFEVLGKGGYCVKTQCACGYVHYHQRNRWMNGQVSYQCERCNKKYGKKNKGLTVNTGPKAVLMPDPRRRR